MNIYHGFDGASIELTQNFGRKLNRVNNTLLAKIGSMQTFYWAQEFFLEWFA